MVDPRAGLLECAARDGDLAEGALWLAAEECEGVDPAPWLRLLDELGDELRARCGSVPTGRAAALAVPVLAGLLGDRLRLRGADGGDPRTHYLPEVLARGRGIPIACATVWIAVGRRAGIPVEGVGLPGHFVVRVGDTLVDAHARGAVLDEAAARAMVAASLGRDPGRLEPDWLKAATVRDILARMSRNLRVCHLARGDWARALLAADRCVDLLPDDPTELRERGAVLMRVGATIPALRDLRAARQAQPDDAGREAVDRLIAQALGLAN